MRTKQQGFQVPSSEPLADYGQLKSEPKRELTFGERLVGLNFNPSNDDKVSQAKKLCAQLADLVEAEFDQRPISSLQSQLYGHTIGEILNAQMNVVKLLTLKY